MTARTDRLRSRESIEEFPADRRARAIDITDEELQRMIEDGFAAVDKERFLREARDMDERRMRRAAARRAAQHDGDSTR